MLLDTQISFALDLLRQGEAVAFPTETVYGLWCDARNVNGVRKILSLKNRPDDKGINVLCNSLEMIEQIGYVRYDLERKLIQKHMPGPLTVILDSLGSVSDKVAREDGTIWVRIPDCKITLSLITQFGYWLATTSANKSGGISPITAWEVSDIFQDTVFCIDGGRCDIGIESTIVRVVDEYTIHIIRSWAISQDTITQEFKNMRFFS